MPWTINSFIPVRLLRLLVPEDGRFDGRVGPSSSGGCSRRRGFGLPNLRLVQERRHRGRNDSHAVRIGESRHRFGFFLFSDVRLALVVCTFLVRFIFFLRFSATPEWLEPVL